MFQLRKTGVLNWAMAFFAGWCLIAFLQKTGLAQDGPDVPAAKTDKTEVKMPGWQAGDDIFIGDIEMNGDARSKTSDSPRPIQFYMEEPKTSGAAEAPARRPETLKDLKGNEMKAPPPASGQAAPEKGGANEQQGQKTTAETEKKAIADMTPEIFRDANGQPIMLPLTKLEDADAKVFLLNRLSTDGINVIIDPEIKCSVSLRLEGVSLWAAAQRVMALCGLGYRINGNILQVGRLSSFIEEKKQRPVVISRPYFLKYMDATEAKALILGESTETGDTKVVIDKDGNASTANTAKTTGYRGLLSDPATVSEPPMVVVNGSTNSLIIKDEAENLKKIIQLIEYLDMPRRQIQIQAWIVETNESTARQIGARWSAVWNPGNTSIWTGSRDVTDGDLNQLRYPLEGIKRGVLPMPQGSSSTGTSNQLSRTSDMQAYDGGLYSLGLGATGSNGSVITEIQALESDGKLRVLSRPELLVQDNKKASITSGSDIYLPTTTLDRIGLNQIPAKLEVNVQPHISSDNTLTLDLELKDRWPDWNAKTQSGAIQVNEKALITKLTVRNGQTIVLGGLRKVTKSNSSDGVPVLKDIPLFGRLFMYSQTSSQFDELMLIIRPTIIISKD
jgi:type IV pilus assembly protein PilQ